MYFIIAFIFSTIAFILAFKVHDKYDPARYFLIMWSAQIIVIYSLFNNSFLFLGYGLVYISIAIHVFSLGTLAGRLVGVPVQIKNQSFNFNQNRALFILKICLVFSLINALLGIYSVGFNVFQIFSFNSLLELNSAAANSRYTGGAKTNLLFNITLIFTYLTPLLGGYLLKLVAKSKRKWCYFSLFPSLIITLTQAVKLGLITSVILFGIGLLVSSYANTITSIKIRPAVIIKYVIYAILFFSILFLSMVFRTGRFDDEIIQIIGKKFINYAFGHLPAFDLWLSENIENINPAGGTRTFYGISNYFGIASREQGVFTELSSYGINSYSGVGTNVYTAFRFILEDFGFLGSLLVVFLSGLISGFSWLMIKKQINILFFQIIQIAVLFFVFMSFATSVWAYTSYIAAIILMYFILKMMFSKKRSNLYLSCLKI